MQQCIGQRTRLSPGGRQTNDLNQCRTDVLKPAYAFCERAGFLPARSGGMCTVPASAGDRGATDGSASEWRAPIRPFAARPVPRQRAGCSPVKGNFMPRAPYRTLPASPASTEEFDRLHQRLDLLTQGTLVMLFW